MRARMILASKSSPSRPIQNSLRHGHSSAPLSLEMNARSFFTELKRRRIGSILNPSRAVTLKGQRRVAPRVSPAANHSRVYLAHLHERENEAKAAKRGGWAIKSSAESPQFSSADQEHGFLAALRFRRDLILESRFARHSLLLAKVAACMANLFRLTNIQLAKSPLRLALSLPPSPKLASHIFGMGNQFPAPRAGILSREGKTSGSTSALLAQTLRDKSSSWLLRLRCPLAKGLNG